MPARPMTRYIAVDKRQLLSDYADVDVRSAVFSDTSFSRIFNGLQKARLFNFSIEICNNPIFSRGPGKKQIAMI